MVSSSELSTPASTLTTQALPMIDPSSSFHDQDHPHFSGACEAGPLFPSSSCNGKIVSARYFSAGASASFPLNASTDFLSPIDAVGHGSHVASIASGNSGVPVVVNGFNYGLASGMAPRARHGLFQRLLSTRPFSRLVERSQTWFLQSIKLQKMEWM